MILLRKVSVISAKIFSAQSAVLRVILILFVLVWAIIFHSRGLPFKYVIENILEGGLLICAFFVLICGLSRSLVDNSSEDDSTKSVITMVLVVSLVISILLSVFAICFSYGKSIYDLVLQGNNLVQMIKDKRQVRPVVNATEFQILAA